LTQFWGHFVFGPFLPSYPATAFAAKTQKMTEYKEVVIEDEEVILPQTFGHRVSFTVHHNFAQRMTA